MIKIDRRTYEELIKVENFMNDKLPKGSLLVLNKDYMAAPCGGHTKICLPKGTTLKLVNIRGGYLFSRKYIPSVLLYVGQLMYIKIPVEEFIAFFKKYCSSTVAKRRVTTVYETVTV